MANADQTDHETQDSETVKLENAAETVSGSVNDSVLTEHERTR